MSNIHALPGVSAESEVMTAGLWALLGVPSELLPLGTGEAPMNGLRPRYKLFLQQCLTVERHRYDLRRLVLDLKASQLSRCHHALSEALQDILGEYHTCIIHIMSSPSLTLAKCMQQLSLVSNKLLFVHHLLHQVSWRQSKAAELMDYLYTKRQMYCYACDSIEFKCCEFFFNAIGKPFWENVVCLLSGYTSLQDDWKTLPMFLSSIHKEFNYCIHNAHILRELSPQYAFPSIDAFDVNHVNAYQRQIQNLHSKYQMSILLLLIDQYNVKHIFESLQRFYCLSSQLYCNALMSQLNVYFSMSIMDVPQYKMDSIISSATFSLHLSDQSVHDMMNQLLDEKGNVIPITQDQQEQHEEEEFLLFNPSLHLMHYLHMKHSLTYPIIPILLHSQTLQLYNVIFKRVFRLKYLRWTLLQNMKDMLRHRLTQKIEYTQLHHWYCVIDILLRHYHFSHITSNTRLMQTLDLTTSLDHLKETHLTHVYTCGRMLFLNHVPKQLSQLYDAMIQSIEKKQSDTWRQCTLEFIQQLQQLCNQDAITNASFVPMVMELQNAI